MTLTLIEKIIANHSKHEMVEPFQIVDIEIDTRAARDFGGPNVVKNIEDHNLGIEDISKTFFTFDTNPTGSDQKYAINQQIVRVFARKHGIKVFDIDNGIGTHTLMSEGLSYPGSTALTTDSHANILGAIGAFGQGMGDKDITAAFTKGKVWFKVPESVKINLNGKRPDNITAKDITLNLLSKFGANQLLGYSVEIYGKAVDALSLDERITIASMATEMGAIILLFTPNEEVMAFSEKATGRKLEKLTADPDAQYKEEFDLDISLFTRKISLPGAPHHTIDISEAKMTKIDSAFIGSCTNGRIEDLREAAKVLKNQKVAPGVVLKIVPTTDSIWNQAYNEGLIKIFKNAGALVSNAGCAGCAAGQVGQNGPGEVTISTGNRNFPGKQGKGDVYLSSPSAVAASAIAGHITTADDLPEFPSTFSMEEFDHKLEDARATRIIKEKPTIVEGRVWYIKEDNIDTDMIFHNRYLPITDPKEMGQYIFDNLEGFENFANECQPDDIVLVQKNFGSGSSRQQAVDGFKALGISAIIAESYGAIYERNAINAAMPIMTYKSLKGLNLENADVLTADFVTGIIKNKTKNVQIQADPFSEVQLEIYKTGGLF